MKRSTREKTFGACWMGVGATTLLMGADGMELASELELVTAPTVVVGASLVAVTYVSARKLVTDRGMIGILGFGGRRGGPRGIRVL